MSPHDTDAPILTFIKLQISHYQTHNSIKCSMQLDENAHVNFAFTYM